MTKIYAIDHVDDGFDASGYVVVWMCRPPLLRRTRFKVTSQRWSEHAKVRFIYAWRRVGKS